MQAAEEPKWGLFDGKAYLQPFEVNPQPASAAWLTACTCMRAHQRIYFNPSAH